MTDLPMLGRPAGRTLTLLTLLVVLLAAPTAVSGQSNSGVTEPGPGEVLAGVVEVRGTAVHPDFLRYELAFLAEANTGAGWIVFAEGNQPVTDGVLAVWDTAVGRSIGAPVFPDGVYRLRLRVVKSDYNYDEYFVFNLTIQNGEPTPIPTAEATATAVPGGATGSANSTPAPAFIQPTPLPSLTPFPTVTPLATVANQVAAGGVQPTVETAVGGLGEWGAVASSRLTRAFWLGASVALLLFGLLLLYLLLRQLGRRLWQQWWQQR